MGRHKIITLIAVLLLVTTASCAKSSNENISAVTATPIPTAIDTPTLEAVTTETPIIGDIATPTENGIIENKDEEASLQSVRQSRIYNSKTLSAGNHFLLGISPDKRAAPLVSLDDETVRMEYYEILDWIPSEEGDYLVSVAAGGDVAIGLSYYGELFTSGINIDVSDWGNEIVSVYAGNAYVIGLDYNGNVYASGYNGDGQCDVSEWTDVIDIATSWRTTIGLTRNNELLFAGYKADNFKIYNDVHKDTYPDAFISEISAGGGVAVGYGDREGDVRDTGTYAHISDGKLWSGGENLFMESFPYINDSLHENEKIYKVAVGLRHMAVWTSEGRLLLTGYVEEYGYYTSAEYPEVTALSKEGDIPPLLVSGGDYVAVRYNDGTVKVAGANDYGQKTASNWTVAVYD
jgi:hypothetical protein